MHKQWDSDDAAALYNLKGWGLKYFGANADGHLVIHPRRDPDNAIDIKRIVDDVVSRGIKMPVLFRFQDILRHRVAQLNDTFRKAIDDHKYKGKYLGVYPIKVNQLREVVEEIVDAGAPYQFGLEAGSKGELMAVLALNAPDALTIVNGYKDESMMRLAIMGLKAGKQVLVVIEKLSELEMLLSVAREAGVRPMIGLRSKLQAQGSGKWKSSSGVAAKFGLTTPEILAAVEQLRAAAMTDCLKLIHFHIGSQITDIQAIKDAVKEGARVYAKLRKAGVPLEYLDCGGGLGVDYDGSHTSGDSSMNYNLKEYVSGVVYTIQEVCKQEQVPEPHIVTESGRALVAHHSLLVVNVFGVIDNEKSPLPLGESPDENAVVKELRELLKALTAKNLAETYHDAVQRQEEANSLFKLGYLSLEDKARVEHLYWQLCHAIKDMMPKAKYRDAELVDMVAQLHDQYLCNFSIFQSLPDAWALSQLFPIVPLQRLNEEPTRRSALVDITCDSDGKLRQFVCKRSSQSTLPLHELNGEPYYLGIFLMGAYQATMGDIHNLFGRVNEVHVFEDEQEPGGYYLEEVIHGQSVRDVLASIQYSEFELVKMFKTSVDAQVKAGALKPREGVDLLNAYEAILQEYTYIDHNGKAPAAPSAANGVEKAAAAAAVPAAE